MHLKLQTSLYVSHFYTANHSSEFDIYSLFTHVNFIKGISQHSFYISNCTLYILIYMHAICTQLKLIFHVQLVLSLSVCVFSMHICRHSLGHSYYDFSFILIDYYEWRTGCWNATLFTVLLSGIKGYHSQSLFQMEPLRLRSLRGKVMKTQQKVCLFLCVSAVT